MKRFLITTLISFVISSAILFAVTERRPGVTVLHLPARCQVEFYGKPVQLGVTVVWACPRQDAVRLWPWPVLQPWYEDWYEESPKWGIESG